MSKLIPRKIKKACKAYRCGMLLRTKWLRCVHTQVLGRAGIYQPRIGDYDTSFSTKYGEKLLSDYGYYGIF